MKRSLTMRRRIRSFSILSLSFFCSRSVLAWYIMTALLHLEILDCMPRWNSRNSLACAITQLKYSCEIINRELVDHLGIRGIQQNQFKYSYLVIQKEMVNLCIHHSNFIYVFVQICPKKNRLSGYYLIQDIQKNNFITRCSS